ncbi:MAG: hypothetical protein Q8L60_10640 [Gammaproteobacteria bacterium]|nr:hypothetical protein [Gammaproteobacteria bacterium]MDP2346805.1 hypothetical protein [Gammaproteobacteria bacterium]
MPTLDLKRPHTVVGGRNPLYYIQNGHGFNRAGDYLGEFDSQGDFVAEAPATAEDTVVTGDGGKSEAELEADRLAAEERARIDLEAQEKAAKEQADAEAKAKADAEAQRLAAEGSAGTGDGEGTTQPAYKGVKAATMKTMCEERGLDFEPSAGREALLAILVADDKAKASA